MTSQLSCANLSDGDLDDFSDGAGVIQSTLPRVLLAEDNVDLREMIALALRYSGCEVVEASDGMSLVDRLTLIPDDAIKPPPDIIVSDMRMPGVSGLNVLGGLHDVGWRIPFILMTAFGDAQVHKDALSFGAVAVIDKPFKLKRLVAVVRRALGQSQ